jgi:1-deoxy-D-xylulose-5-phosphate reductoisomerase
LTGIPPQRELPQHREIVVLGSTGSIGTQALDVIAARPDRFHVKSLLAAGSDVGLLARQALDTGAAVVGVADAGRASDLREALTAQAAGRPIPEVVAGADAATELAAMPAEPSTAPGGCVVLNGINGSIGLRPTLSALAAGHTLALANKESLITGGPLVKAAAAPGQLVPVDSEHSALAQALRSGTAAEVRRLIVTASGGPFRGSSREDLAGVTVEQALAHPTWAMGPVITINSATLVNKGLEVIEAHLLFDVDMAAIDVVVHPQSVIHSMVEFVDGALLAQASPPDMRLPIALGLSWPDRVPRDGYGCDFAGATAWTFEPLDHDTFPAVRLAQEAGRRGGTAPGIYNAANEECVAAFRAGALSFTGIVDTIAAVLDAARRDGIDTDAGSIDAVLAAEDWAWDRAGQLIRA